MNSFQALVRDFHRKMDQPYPNDPTLVGFRTGLRVKLILEEAREFAEAAGFTADGHVEPTDEAPDWPEMIDALCDLLYVTFGAAVEMGVDIEPFFREVHRTNMEKAGGPIRATDGKVLKPKGWKPPDIAAMLDAYTRPCVVCGQPKKTTRGVTCGHRACTGAEHGDG